MMPQAGPNPQEPDLSIIIVSWNVKTLLDQCLRSIQASLAASDPAPTCQVIVVDSASHDGSPHMVATQHPDVQLVALEENVGFTRGNNIGLRRSQGRHVLLLNPDTEVIGAALAIMTHYADTHPQVGVVGPKLLNPDRSVQSSKRRFPTLATAYLESTVLQQWFPNNRAVRRYYISDRSDDEEQEVGWVKGACFLVRRQAFEDAGLLDESFFMYSEEMDWQQRIHERGWSVCYVPAAQVIHHGEQSSTQVSAAQHIYFESSKVYYYHKHHGWLTGELLRGFLLANYAYQWLVEGFKWLLGHKRSLRAQRLSVYGQVLRSRLTKAGRGL